MTFSRGFATSMRSYRRVALLRKRLEPLTSVKRLTIAGALSTALWPARYGRCPSYVREYVNLSRAKLAAQRIEARGHRY